MVPCKPCPRMALAPPTVVPAATMHHRPSRRRVRPSWATRSRAGAASGDWRCASQGLRAQRTPLDAMTPPERLVPEACARSARVPPPALVAVLPSKMHYRHPAVAHRERRTLTRSRGLMPCGPFGGRMGGANRRRDAVRSQSRDGARSSTRWPRASACASAREGSSAKA